MKKILAMILAMIMVMALVACGNQNSTSGGDTSGSSTGVATTTPDSSSGGDTGRVYWLNMKPEADEALQALAAAYEAQTGVPTKVVTAASGSYDTTLNAEMGKSEAPTLINVGNGSSLATWEDYCLTLDGADVMGELTTTDFNLKNAAGETKSLGWIYESFGIITNKALLEQAGYSIADIKDFASLKAVAEDIHARSAQLGFDAFTSSGLYGSSSWRFSGHLSNMPLYYEFRDDGITDQPAAIKGTYLDNYRAIWDLYIDNASASKTSLSSATGDQAEAEFGEGKAVFYQNGTWEWSNLTEKFNMNPDDLTMIPIYCGVAGEEKAGVCSGTENCLAVNSKVSEADQKATLDFLYWCVTSDEGLKTLSGIGDIPFKKAPAATNGLSAAAADLLAKGNYAVTWAFNYTPNVDSWRATLVTALTAYSADQSDAKWADVVAAVVDGWAYEYQVVNG